MDRSQDAIVYFVVFLFSTTLHEAAHAWVAMLGGDLTAYHGGQVTLDPRPHIKREPFGMIILPLLTAAVTGWPIGFASAPYDPEWARRHPGRSALMSVAGPCANLLIVLVSALLIHAGIRAGIFYQPQTINFGHIVGTDAGPAWYATSRMLGGFFCVNVLLATFNLIPLPPLDGSGILPYALGGRVGAAYQEFILRNPAVSWIGMLIAWQVYGHLFLPIFLGFVNLLYPGQHYG